MPGKYKCFIWLSKLLLSTIYAKIYPNFTAINLFGKNLANTMVPISDSPMLQVWNDSVMTSGKSLGWLW